jgi:hypothetical protein
MNRTLERILIATTAAATALAISTGVGQGTSSRGGYVDIPRGQAARFLGTTATCVNPKGQIPGGQVACAVLYSAPTNIAQLIPGKYRVTLALRCIDLGKSTRTGASVKSSRFC